MKFDYDVEEGNHSFQVTLKAFPLAEVHYKTDDGCKTPLTRREAKELAEEIKGVIESKYPIEILDEDDYKSTFGDFIEFLESKKECDCDDDSCGCDSDKMDSFMKMMLLSKLMAD